MNQNKIWGWVAVVIIIILIALGIWWYAAGSASMSPSFSTTATSTAATSTNPASPTMTDMRGSSVQAIVASVSGASEFQSLFNSTGVAASLRSGEQYTVFVPLNTAFSNVTKGTISKMTAAQLKRLVQYHIIAGKEVQVGTQTLGEVQALSGDPLNFSDTNNIPMVNSSIVVSEYQGSNGIVYVINDVLIPPQTTQG